MFTLKVHTDVYCRDAEGAPSYVSESNDHFIPADEVRAFGYFGRSETPVPSEFASWLESSIEVERDIHHSAKGETGSTIWDSGRLLEVRRDGEARWILASHAWLLGADGGTIERLV
jgi:hypothetical protein